MKYKYYLTAALLLFAVNMNAGGLFSAAWKPKPSVTLFGQKLTWPLPSLCVGKAAGVLPDAGVNSSGINLKVPYLAIDIPFPSLTVSAGDKKVELKLGSVDKSEHKPKEKE